MNRHGFYTVGLVILLLAIGVNTYYTVSDHGRLNHNEHQTCVIQGRGLEGQRHLTAIMRDIAALLTPAPAVHAAPVPPSLVAPLANLREQLGEYVTIERAQPAGRSC
ncbi:MAG TPA: hypothetical protein VK756_07855 [Solirubrobacteraceae bacterium]|jgi:hypothetical protein|nr:hypothetical protein [Solirubrobacteraceae bacterium]